MSSRLLFHAARRLRVVVSLLLAALALVLALQASPPAHAAANAAANAAHSSGHDAHTPTAHATSGSLSSGPLVSGSVSIVNFAFDPQVVTITAGSSVQWTNSDITTHTVTSDIGAWNSKELGPGDVVSMTFAAPGDYTYHCVIHGFMTGRVVVLTFVYLPLVMRS